MIRSSGSTIPPDFQPSISAAHHLQKHRNATKAAITNADQSYATSTSLSQSSIDPPPVQAALLSSLLKSLATAEGAVKESIRTRKAVIDSLNKILTSHIQSLEDDRSKAQVLGDRVKEVELRKQEVENSIMRELSSGHSADGIDVANVPQGMKLELGSTTPPGLPAAEDMTPPPVEDFTPPGSPSIAVTANENSILPFLSTSLSSTDPTSQILPPLHPTSIRSPPGPFATSPTSATTPHSSHFPPGSAPLAHPEFAAAGAKRDSMSAFGTAAVGGEEDGTGGGGGGGGGKRKKSAHEQDEDVLMDGDAIEGFDEDLRELLRQESRSGGVRIA